VELYEEIKADREAGARRLVAEYRSRLMAVAMGLTSSSHEAEDLVFRTFEQVILKIDTYKATGSFYYWVCSILTNYHRMDLRKAASRPKFTGDGTIPEVAAEETGDIADRMDFDATAETVREAVRELPDNFREVVVFRYFDEMSVEDIAMVTGLNVGTVKSRLHYAKEALYAKLHDNEVSAKFTDRLILATRRRLHMRWAVGAVASLVICTLVGGAVISLGTGGGASGFGGGGRFHGYGGGSVRRAASLGGKTVGSDAVDRAIANGLEYLARNQRENGSYPGQYGESAAVPALAGMAFLAKGCLPGGEPYGENIERAIDYILSCADLRDSAPFRGYMGGKGNGRMYAHAIATLFLSEASGMVDAKRQAKIDELLPLATKVILDAQNQRKDGNHLGGWRYEPNSHDSDLSCSGWALMALRSARLNGAPVPPEAIEKAVLYIKRAYRESDGTFGYQGANGGNANTLSGAAILCLELCGKHLDPMSLKAAKYLQGVHTSILNAGQQYYGLYYTAQGLFQIGGPIWKSFAAWMYDQYVPAQRADGSWGGNGNNGSDVFATAMTVLSLTVPYRMLPIYQRDETVDPDSEKEDKR